MQQFLNIPDYNGAAVYCIENIQNHKIYIGSTIHLHSRIKNHIYGLKNNRHHSKKLQADYNNGDKFEVYYTASKKEGAAAELEVKKWEHILIISQNAIRNGYNAISFMDTRIKGIDDSKILLTDFTIDANDSEKVKVENYIPVIPKTVEKIDFDLLLHDNKYQCDILRDFGSKGFEKLIDLAIKKNRG